MTHHNQVIFISGIQSWLNINESINITHILEDSKEKII